MSLYQHLTLQLHHLKHISSFHWLGDPSWWASKGPKPTSLWCQRRRWQWAKGEWIRWEFCLGKMNNSWINITGYVPVLVIVLWRFPFSVWIFAQDETQDTHCHLIPIHPPRLLQSLSAPKIAGSPAGPQQVPWVRIRGSQPETILCAGTGDKRSLCRGGEWEFPELPGLAVMACRASSPPCNKNK